MCMWGPQHSRRKSPRNPRLLRGSLPPVVQPGIPSDSSESGQALLEFSLCLPVLLLVVTGVCSFGIYLSQYLVLTNGVTVAAQALALDRGQTTDPCADTLNAFTGAAPTLNPNKATYSIVLNGTTYSSSVGTQGTTTFSCSSSSTSTGAAANLVQGTPATVTVNYPCTLSVYGKNIIPVCSIKSQTAESVQ